MKILSVLLIAFTLLAAGCGKSEPRIDASSDQALEQSLERVAESLPESEREAFGVAVVELMMADMLTAAMAGSEAESEAIMARAAERLDGLTGREVIALAEQRRQQ